MDAFVESRNHPAIAYTTGQVSDPVAALNQRLQDGATQLSFEPVNGYLRSVLDALGVPVQSQTLVFSQTSFEAPLINLLNPRALYFNDRVAVGWVRGGRVLEIAAQDPRQGVNFYTLEQQRREMPRFERNTTECMQCHLTWETLGVPGLIVMSTYPLADKFSYANGFVNDHRSPFNERWGGWYVTGTHGSNVHMGNIPVMPEDKGKSKLTNPVRPRASLEGLFDLSGYATPYSDVVALMVLAHQTRMTNLLTRTSWEARLVTPDNTGDATKRVQAAATEMVDYMLFVDEIRLTAPIKGTAGFAEVFAAQGPRDSRGRSFRDLDLQRRLFRYPCSYVIYSDAFDAMPAPAKEAVYSRMWQILSGQERAPKYTRLSLADRQAVVEILRETKKDLPAYFQPVTR